jgi:hypothetical protein
MAAIEMPITEHIRSNTSKRGRIRMAIHDWTADLLTPVKSARLLGLPSARRFVHISKLFRNLASDNLPAHLPTANSSPAATEA